MEANFPGYLLEVLDPAERRQVEQYLREHPEAQPALDRTRRTLELLAVDADEPVPPPDLRWRTLARVAEIRCRALPQAPRPLISSVIRRSWWRRADVLVAAAILLTLAGLGFSGLAAAWQRQRILACQQNLNGFHKALVRYSDLHDGAFPKVEDHPPFNRPGMIVPLLQERGLLASDVTVSCPANGQRSSPSLTLDELVDMQDKRPGEFERLVGQLCGCYAYTLGYEVDGQDGKVLYGLRLGSGDDRPIMADRPPYHSPSRQAGNSPNHGGHGQNVLFIGGHVKWLRDRAIGTDDIYLNCHDQVAAGEGPLDSVLGPGAAQPCPSGNE